MEAPSSRILCDIDLDQNGKQAGYLRVPNSVNESAYGTILIPIWSIRNGKEPTILLTGGVHGDEYEGPVALRKIARSLDPSEVVGGVIIIPGLNVPAIRAGTRTSPIDGLNMNRIFPGDRDGSVTMMIAHFVDAILLSRIDYQIDLHSGGKTLEFLPMVSFKESRDKDRETRTLKAAMAFDAPYVLLNRDLDETGLLESSCEARGILHFGSELGGAGRVTPEYVKIAERGVMNVLRYLGIRDSAAIPSETIPKLVEVEDLNCYVMAEENGIFEPFLDLGSTVQEGEVIGQVHIVDNIGTGPVPLNSARRGIVICRRPLGDVRRGDNVMIIGRYVSL
jgi:N-alpha-acetyl-L-2,4-diaminobutyrate deacetylase